MLWQVSGRRYETFFPVAPTDTSIIMLKERTPPKSFDLHFEHLMLCFLSKASKSEGKSDSATGPPIAEPIRVSARKTLPHFLHSTTGSLKFARWPDATKTSFGKTCEPVISTKPSFCTSSFRQNSVIFLRIADPSGPKSKKPAGEFA